MYAISKNHKEYDSNLPFFSVFYVCGHICSFVKGQKVECFRWVEKGLESGVSVFFFLFCSIFSFLSLFTISYVHNNPTMDYHQPLHVKTHTLMHPHKTCIRKTKNRRIYSMTTYDDA